MQWKRKEGWRDEGWEDGESEGGEKTRERQVCVDAEGHGVSWCVFLREVAQVVAKEGPE